MRKLLLPLLFMAGTVNAASSVKEICTDYTKYLGHVYGFAVSQDESMRKKLLSDMKRLKLSEAMVQQELKWFTEFGHLNRGDMLTSEQHRCHNEKKKFQRRV